MFPSTDIWPLIPFIVVFIAIGIWAFLAWRKQKKEEEEIREWNLEQI